MFFCHSNMTNQTIQNYVNEADTFIFQKFIDRLTINEKIGADFIFFYFKFKNVKISTFWMSGGGDIYNKKKKINKIQCKKNLEV